MQRGETTLRGVNSYNSHFCNRVGYSIIVGRRLPGLSSGRASWHFSDEHPEEPPSTLTRGR